MKTYQLPPTFYHDHRSRDLPEEGTSTVVRETKTAVFVEMDGAAYRDLLSDAEYYSDPGIARDMGMPGLAASARATVRRLTAEGPPERELLVGSYISRRTRRKVRIVRVEGTHTYRAYADGTLAHEGTRAGAFRVAL